MIGKNIANMFFIPNGLFAKMTPSIVAASGLTPEQLSTLTVKSFLQINRLE